MSKCDFDSLSEQQLNVFEQIAINNDGGHSFVTIYSLLRLGFIESYLINDGPYAFAKYRVPLNVHIQWCEWVSKSSDGADVDGG